MRLEIATAVAALAATCAADAMMVFSECNVVSGTCLHDVGVWFTGYGAFRLNSEGGCRGQSNGMVDFCMDCTPTPTAVHGNCLDG